MDLAKRYIYVFVMRRIQSFCFEDCLVNRGRSVVEELDQLSDTSACYIHVRVS